MYFEAQGADIIQSRYLSFKFHGVGPFLKMWYLFTLSKKSSLLRNHHPPPPLLGINSLASSLHCKLNQYLSKMHLTVYFHLRLNSQVIFSLKGYKLKLLMYF
jgi:hypothetical protein